MNLYFPLFLIASTFSFLNSWAFAQPVISSTEKVFDTGLVSTNNGEALASHDFYVENKGTQKLIISNYSISCSCADVQGPLEILPGRGENIRITMRVQRPFSKDRPITVAISTNDPVTPILVLELIGRAKASAYVTPLLIDFGTIEYGQKSSRSLYVFLPTNQEYTSLIRKITPANSGIFRTQVIWQKREKTVDTKRNATVLFNSLIDIELESNATLKSGKSSVLIELSSGDSIKVPVIWHVDKLQVFEPQRFYMPKSLDSAEDIVSIVYNSGVAGKLKSIYLIGKGIEIVDSYETDYRWIIRVKKTNERPTANCSLRVENEEGKIFSLPFTFE